MSSPSKKGDALEVDRWSSSPSSSLSETRQKVCVAFCRGVVRRSIVILSALVCCARLLPVVAAAVAPQQFLVCLDLTACRTSCSCAVLLPTTLVDVAASRPGSLTNPHTRGNGRSSTTVEFKVPPFTRRGEISVACVNALVSHSKR